MDTRDPRMLPGPTAFALGRIVSTIVVIAVSSLLLAGAGALVAKFIPHFSRWGGAGAYVGVLLALVGLFILCIIVGTPIGTKQSAVQKAEIAAGYTTMLKQFDQVDGIDPATGAVVREAKPRTLTLSALPAFSTGSELGSIPGMMSSARQFARSRGIFVAFVLTFVLLCLCAYVVAGSAGSVNLSGTQAAALVVGILDVVAVLTLLTLGLIDIPAQYAKQFAHFFTGARVYRGFPRKVDAIDELLPPDAELLPGAKARASNYLVFTDDHLAIYSRQKTTMLPWLVIPRSRISGSSITSLPQARSNPVPAPVLTVTKDDGSPYNVTLTLNNLSPTSTAKDLVPVAEWIALWAKGSPSASGA